MNKSFFASLDEVRTRLARAPQLLVCLDVDCILLADADQPPRSLLRLYRMLSTRPGVTVAILSSRSRAELQAQVTIPGLVFVGNLGLEISGDGFLLVEPTAASYAEKLGDLAARLSARLAAIPGVQVEDKGLVIRVAAADVAANAEEEVRRLIHDTLAGANHPFQLSRRGHVHEIRPRVPWNKTHAVLWIKERLEQPDALVIYVTDDEDDNQLRAALPQALIVKVGQASEPATAGGVAAPDSETYCLENPAEFEAFLTWLVQQRGS